MNKNTPMFHVINLYQSVQWLAKIQQIEKTWSDYSQLDFLSSQKMEEEMHVSKSVFSSN